jgi:hypothetical protein
VVPRARLAVAAALAVLGALVAGVGLRSRPLSLRPHASQVVTEEPETSINSHSSPVAAADTRRPDVVVVADRIDAPNLACTVAVSTTAGEAWRPVALPLAPGASNCFWPDAAFDADGNLLVLYTPTGGPFNLPLGLWLQRYRAGLAPDGPPTHVAGPLAFEPRLAVADGGVLVAWIQAGDARAAKPLGFGPPPNPILVARSSDGGRTFAAPVQVSEAGRLAVQPSLLAGPAGAVVVGALDLGDDRSTYESLDEGAPGPPPQGPWRVVAWRSADGGATFGAAAVVIGQVTPPQRVLVDLAPAPAFAVDTRTGRVYAAWEAGGGDGRDVFMSSSGDGGSTWSAPRRLGPSHGGQFLPGIGVAADGRVDVAFYDRSRDPGDTLAEVVLASSTDEGRTFATRALSDRRFDSSVGSRTGEGVMLGSHLAVVSQGGRAVVIWPDPSRGTRVNGIVDLAASRVEMRPGRGARRPLVVLGLLLLLAGVAVAAVAGPTGRRR